MQIAGSPSHAAIVLHEMGHVDIGSLSNFASSLFLNFLLGGTTLGDFARIITGRFLADAEELAVHVVDAGELNAAPHGGELWLDVMVEGRVVLPDLAGDVALFGAIDENLVLGFEAGQLVLAVGPAVFEVLNPDARRVALALQVSQQGSAVLDVCDDGVVRKLARVPGLLGQRPVGLPQHAGMLL